MAVFRGWCFEQERTRVQIRRALPLDQAQKPIAPNESISRRWAICFNEAGRSKTNFNMIKKLNFKAAAPQVGLVSLFPHTEAATVVWRSYYITTLRLVPWKEACRTWKNLVTSIIIASEDYLKARINRTNRINCLDYSMIITFDDGHRGN